MKKIIFAVAIACGCAQFAHTEQVENWFTGYADGTEAKATNGAWPQEMPEYVTVESSQFNLDLGHDESLSFTPTASKAPDTNVITRIVSEVSFRQMTSELPTSLTDVKTAIAVKGDKYQAYTGSAWVALSGATPPTTAGELVKVLVEMDYRTATPKVRFGIVGDSTTTYLTGTGAVDGWFTLASDSRPERLVTSVSYSGSGVVKDLDGKVQIGLFEVAGVKYGTSDEAVAAANKGTDKVVKVLRDNSETITIGADQAVIVDTNGKTCSGGVVNNNPGVSVPVAVPETEVAKGNGEIEIKTTVTGDYMVVTPDTSKEIVAGSVKEKDGKTYATVATRNSIIENKLTVAGKTLTVNDTLKSYLTAYGGKTEGTYAGPSSSKDTIQGQLNATPEGATRTMGQSYALGLAPTEAIVLQPAGADTNKTAVTLNMPNVKPNSDFTVKYKAQKFNGTDWVNVDESAPTDTPQIPVGSGRFRVNTVITGK